MPIEIKELKIKAVISTPTATTPSQPSGFTPVQLENWKKEIIKEALEKVKEYLKEQTER